MGVVGGPAIFYGRCDGGPWHAKDMAHHTLDYRVAIDELARKAYPGMQSSPDPGITFGVYRFDSETKKWVWHPPSAAPKRVDNQKR